MNISNKKKYKNKIKSGNIRNHIKNNNTIGIDKISINSIDEINKFNNIYSSDNNICEKEDEVIEFSPKLILHKFISILYYLAYWFLNISGFYIIWILLHFAASHIYVELCVPKSLYGLIISTFLTSAPHCQALKWIIYNGANTINSMWFVIGSWFCKKILFYPIKKL